MEYIRKAVGLIAEENKIIGVSSVYETSPFGKKNQADFLNAVIVVRTKEKLQELFTFIKGVEKKTGRKVSEKWGAREVDIDILFYNNEIVKNEILTVPHKGIPERDFVLVPLMEVSPDFVHPELNKTAEELLKKVTEKNIIRIFPAKIF